MGVKRQVREIGILVTLGMVAGEEILAATAVKTVTPSAQKLQTEHLFEDSIWWDEVEEEESSSGAQFQDHTESVKSY